MSPLPTRSEVRRQGRTARLSLVGSARSDAMNALIGHLKQMHLVAHAPSVGVVVADDGEPDLAELMQWLWARGTVVALPVLLDDADDYSMRFVPVLAEDALSPGRFGIPLPPPRYAVEPDLLLVPFVGFDAAGNRVGRGGGFFLSLIHI